MKAMAFIAILAVISFAGCTDTNGDDTSKYTTPDMDDQGRYVITVGPEGTNVFGIKYAKVPVGSTVVWVFEGGVEPHNVKADDGSFENTISKEAWEFEWTFDTAGTYSYHCVPHQSVDMTGEVLVEGEAMMDDAMDNDEESMGNETMEGGGNQTGPGNGTASL